MFLFPLKVNKATPSILANSTTSFNKISTIKEDFFCLTLFSELIATRG